MGSKKGMVLYYDMTNIIEKLDGETAKKLVLAMLRYSESGTMPEEDLGDCSLVFELVKGQIDRDNEKYQRTVEKRSKAGRASVKSKAEHMLTNSTHVNTCQQNQHMLTHATDTVTDTDKDTVTDTVTDTDTNPDTDTVGQAGGLDALMESFGLSEGVGGAVRSFLDMREKNGAPMDYDAVVALLSSLVGMSQDPATQKAILEQSIIYGWKGIFPLVEETRQRPEKARYFRQINNHDHGTDYNTIVAQMMATKGVGG